MPRLSAKARVIGLTATPIHPQASEPCARTTPGAPGRVSPGSEKPQIRTIAPIAMRMRLCLRSNLPVCRTSSFPLLARRTQRNAELGGLLIGRADAALELARDGRGLGLLASERLERPDIVLG